MQVAAKHQERDTLLARLKEVHAACATTGNVDQKMAELTLAHEEDKMEVRLGTGRRRAGAAGARYRAPYPLNPLHRSRPLAHGTCRHQQRGLPSGTRRKLRMQLACQSSRRPLPLRRHRH